jgi:hypothetical protein
MMRRRGRHRCDRHDGVLRAADERDGTSNASTVSTAVLADVPDGDDPDRVPRRDYLLVGSDSREGSRATSADAGAIGDVGDVQGRRSTRS